MPLLITSRPNFDSPSLFCRILDKHIGGHYSIKPKAGALTTKQQYLPSSNVLQTRFMQEEGVLNVVDFFPIPERPSKPVATSTLAAGNPAAIPVHSSRGKSPQPPSIPAQEDPKRWLVRRIDCIRGKIDVEVEVFPVYSPLDFNLARILTPDGYRLLITPAQAIQRKSLARVATILLLGCAKEACYSNQAK
jgi:GH15 family glucan-1,4-alpha-glucosidase